MAEALVPGIIVLALGAGVLGFPDALRLLVDVAGRSPLLDISTCVLAMAVVTAHVFGTILLARFVRKQPRAGAGASGDEPAPRRRRAPPTDLFARMTLAVSLGAASLVSACLCLLAAPGAGGLGLLYHVADIARKSGSRVVAGLVAIATVLVCARPLLRALGGEESVHGQGAPASSSTDAERSANATQMVRFAVAGLSSVAVFLLLVVGVSVGVGAALGAMLLARFTRTVHNAANAGGRAAPAPPPPPRDTRRFSKLIVVPSAVFFCALVTTYYYAQIERDPDGAKYWCSA